MGGLTSTSIARWTKINRRKTAKGQTRCTGCRHRKVDIQANPVPVSLCGSNRTNYDGSRACNAVPEGNTVGGCYGEAIRSTCCRWRQRRQIRDKGHSGRVRVLQARARSQNQSEEAGNRSPSLKFGQVPRKGKGIRCVAYRGPKDRGTTGGAHLSTLST